MDYVWMILKRDLRVLFKPEGKPGLRRRFLAVAGPGLYLGLMVLCAWGAERLFSYLEASLSSAPPFRMAIEINLLNGASLFVLTMAFLTGMQATYRTIYESDDIGFLMAQPVPVRSIFVAKFVTAFGSFAVIAGLFGVPVWVGYGSAIGAGPLFYAVAILALSMLLLLAHSAVSLLLLLAMRYLPGRKMKQLFVGLSAVFGVLIVLATQILSRRMQEAGDPSNLLEMIGKGHLDSTWYLPSTWMVRAALGTARERGLNPIPNGILLLAVAALLSWGAIWVSGRWFMMGWAGRTEEVDAGKKRRPAWRSVPSSRLLPGPRGSYWAILRKDLRLLFRDPLVWYNLAVSVIVIGFFLLNMRSTQGAPQRPEARESPMAGMVFLYMPVMMGAVTGGQTGGVSISREGSSFWLLRSSPASPAAFLGAKLTYAILPPAALLAASTAAMRLMGFPGCSPGFALLYGGSMILAVASIQILMDAVLPDFSFKVELGSSGRGRGTGKLLTTMFASMGLVVFMVFILGLPSTPLARRWFPAAPANAVAVMCRCVVVGGGVVASLLAWAVGLRRVGRMFRDM